MLAIFVIRQYPGHDVHILENNQGLLIRDEATYRPLFAKFGIQSVTKIEPRDPNGKPKVCYCLKKDNQKFFSENMQGGKLSLEKTILIVDEVDDLVVNEKPTVNYTKADADLSPHMQSALKAVASGGERPPKVPSEIWYEAKKWRNVSEKKTEKKDYTKGPDGKFVELVDGKVAKVPKTYGWLTFLNFSQNGTSATKQTPFLTMCTPYMYCQYACIFGLTGSVGGDAEKDYIRKTFQAVPFQVPLFLNTCEGAGKSPAVNRGFHLLDSDDQMIEKVIALTKEYFVKVPVLIITKGRVKDEMLTIWRKLRGKDGDPKSSPLWQVRPDFTQKSVDMLREMDERGQLESDRWNDVIRDTTLRIGTGTESYYSVTVTDIFGGRGHDFNCAEEHANNEGGMLVIATTVPDTREWIQWTGRTARQDRPGQFVVVMSKEDEIFKKDEEAFKGSWDSRLDADGKIDKILKVQDGDIQGVLQEFSAEQAQGYWLNELCDTYYRGKPHAVGDRWPSERWPKEDKQLRDVRPPHIVLFTAHVHIVTILI